MCVGAGRHARSAPPLHPVPTRFPALLHAVYHAHQQQTQQRAGAPPRGMMQ